MESCCAIPSAGAAICELAGLDLARPSAAACPSCGTPGKSVQLVTVRAMLVVSLRLVQSVEYHFCRSPDCAVVYYAVDGSQIFTSDHLREPVFQKQPDTGTATVCYCFRHTISNVRDATADQQAAILRDIRAGIQAEQCACDLRNPQGACCLGNVRALIRHSAKNAPAPQTAGDVA